MTLVQNLPAQISQLQKPLEKKFFPQINSPNYKIIHKIPGRWRLKVEELTKNLNYANNLVALLENIEGISQVRFNPSAKCLVIKYEPENLNEEQVKKNLSVCLEKAKCEELLPGKITKTTEAEPEYLQRLGIPFASLFLALIATPLELPPLLIGGLILAACLPAYIRAWEALTLEKTLTVDFQDSLAITLSAAQGHFVPPAFMISLIESGELIRDATARSSERQTLDLLDSLGQFAWVEKDGVEVQVPLKNINAGDVVIVYPGDLIPIDGKIIRGQALIDQQKLTGESVPVYRNLEEEVYASTLVVEGQLAIAVERTGKNTRAGLVVELMKAAPVHDTRIENYAAKFANFAVVPTLLLGGGVFAATGDLARATAIITLDFGTGIRVSVPTAVLAGLTSAARTGVFIRSGRALEMLSKIDCVVFDKTGTLTQGKAKVVDIKVFNKKYDYTTILTLAATAEKGLTHPVAQAIVQEAENQGIKTLSCEEWDYRVGLGVMATIEGQKILVGSSRFMTNQGIDITQSKSLKTGSISLVYVASDQHLLGVIMYSDPIRSESPQVIAELHKQHITTHMLTGDIQKVANSVAKKLGIDPQEIHAQAFPERKVEVVKKLKEQGKTVAFIGDGINDSAALAYADVSISFAAGSDIARETADIVLMDDDLSGLIHAIAISRVVMDIIYQNVFIVGVPNFGALIAGLLFALDPVLAIVINNGSAILAGLNGLRPVIGEGKKHSYQNSETQNFSA